MGAFRYLCIYLFQLYEFSVKRSIKVLCSFGLTMCAIVATDWFLWTHLHGYESQSALPLWFWIFQILRIEYFILNSKYLVFYEKKYLFNDVDYHRFINKLYNSKICLVFLIYSIFSLWKCTKSLTFSIGEYWRNYRKKLKHNLMCDKINILVHRTLRFSFAVWALRFNFDVWTLRFNFDVWTLRH